MTERGFAPNRYLERPAPSSLADVIDKALAKEPADRWPSAAAMRAALLG